jgi:hypothetical protein
MKVELLYVTPAYHKLVESVARVCYQSYHKCSPTSHTMLKGIMAKGHLSVASVGNIVFGINFLEDTDAEDELHVFAECITELIAFKEITNYVRWTTSNISLNPGTNYDLVVSMNVLAFLDILKQYNKLLNGIMKIELYNDTMLKQMLEAIMQKPEVAWFIDNTIEVEPMDNPYIVEAPTFGNPIILSEDYNALKDILTPYELEYHATVTVDILTDRATGLQMWRHADQTGGCELSQRYVDRSNAEYRLPVDMEDLTLNEVYNAFMNQHIENYITMRQLARDAGYNEGRVKEIARNVLPNIATRIIQCRPLRQWKHFFNLRDSVHAQKEICQDTQAIKRKFAEKGIPL